MNVRPLLDRRHNRTAPRVSLLRLHGRGILCAAGLGNVDVSLCHIRRPPAELVHELVEGCTVSRSAHGGVGPQSVEPSACPRSLPRAETRQIVSQGANVLEPCVPRLCPEYVSKSSANASGRSIFTEISIFFFAM